VQPQLSSSRAPRAAPASPRPARGRPGRSLGSALVRAPLAAVLLGLALVVIVPAAARASGVQTGPQGIAVNSSGDVYVSDWAHNTVDEITPQGVSIVAGIPGHSGAPMPGPATDSRLDKPVGLAVSKAGDLYINDSGNDVIEKVTPAGTLSIVAGEVGHSGTPTPGPATSSTLTIPVGIAVDSHENLYIADQGTQEGPNNVIEKVTPSGTLSIFAGELGASGEPTPGPATDSMLNEPQGVAVDGVGNVYIADTSNGVVEKVNTEGILSIYARSYFPQGVAASASGEVYVAGNGNTVDKVEPAGQLSRIAGTGQAGEPTPGPATRSMLDRPDAAAVDSAGNVYISDQGNDMVEKVTPAGELSIIWAAEDPIPGSTLTVARAGSGSGTVTSSPSGITCPETCFGGYEPDTPVTLTATPLPGSAFVGWEGAGCLGTGTCQVTMSSDMAVTATFQQLAPVTLTVALAGSGSGSVSSSPSGIACPGTCSYAYPPGTPVMLTPTAASGSRFVGWEGAGCSGTSTCEVTLSEAKSVTAMFEATSKKFALTVSKAGSGSGAVECEVEGSGTKGACAAEYAEGAQLVLTASAAGGSTFTGWSGACSGTGTCKLAMDKEQVVTATFSAASAKTFKLTVSTAGSGSGTVECEVEGSGIKGACATEYQEGAKLVLIATPNGGSTFAGWSGACTGTGTCKLTMSKEQAVTATFEPKPVSKFKLGVSKTGSGSGTVECEVEGSDVKGPCASEYQEGTKLLLAAMPTSGSTFSGWSGACTGTAPCKLTMSEEQSATASFEANAASKFKLGVSTTGSGSGTVECEVEGSGVKGPCAAEYEEGAKLVLIATPNGGSTFAGWSGACTGAGPCKLTMSTDTAVTAVFEKLLASPFERELPIEPFKPPTTAASVYLAGTRITTTRSKAGVKLTCSGTGTAMCSGELTLAAESTTKRGRSKTETIGATTFSIQTGKTATIELKLDAAGGALLDADHGRLRANLTALKSSPVPSQSYTESVQLVRVKARGKTRH